MNYENRFENVTVLGAAGKMGSGILLLTSMEMFGISQRPENKEKNYVLYALDVSQDALSGLMAYIQDQLAKQFKRKAETLRQIYIDKTGINDDAVIAAMYVKDVMSLIRPVTTIESTYESHLIFEAASENPALKVKLLSQINKNTKVSPWFFTNTSSIPINYLDSEANLNGSIIGFHFYNPPAVQKLVELIKCNRTKPEIHEFARHLIKQMHKIEVPSYDFAGFIGNGHFMRDAIHGITTMERLNKEMSFPEAVYCVNKITQDFMIRPMGIFQLIDYVGIDVCSLIMKVMRPYVKDEVIHSPLLDRMMETGIKGGQNHDGSQKNGFLKYEKGVITAIFDIDKKDYIKIEDFAPECDKKLGDPAPGHIPWKSIISNKDRAELLAKYFSAMKVQNTTGAAITIEYMKKSKAIGEKLVTDKVAYSAEDVNTVLLTGFLHAYGPINNFTD